MPSAISHQPCPKALHLLLEAPSPLRVIAEHVEARARGREQHHARRLRQLVARARSRRRSCPPPPPARRRRAPRAAAAAPRRSRRPPSRAPSAARAAAARSPPLNRPPMIGTRSRSKLSIERSADSTLVAFESLTNRTPPTSATSSIACSRPWNASTAAVIAAGAAPAIAPTVAAAITSLTRCGPEQVDRVERHEPLRDRPPGDRQSSRPRRPCRGRSRRRAKTDARARPAAARQLEHRRIVGVDHREVARVLVLEDPRLRRAVRLDVGMPIEVVGRKIQHHRDPRMERVDLLELKAARLDDVKRVRRRLGHLRAQRRADVAADGHLESGRLEHPPGQRRRRRLALGAGDRDHPALQPSRRELDLRDHRDAAIARRLHRRPAPAARRG